MGLTAGAVLVLVSDQLLGPALSQHLLGQRLEGRGAPGSSAATQVSTEKVPPTHPPTHKPTHPPIHPSSPRKVPRTPSLTAVAHALLFPCYKLKRHWQQVAASLDPVGGGWWEQEPLRHAPITLPTPTITSGIPFPLPPPSPPSPPPSPRRTL